MGPIVFIVATIFGIWVYADALKFRKLGVNVKPGLVASLVIILGILISSSLDQYSQTSAVIFGLGIPSLLYFFRYRKYKKLAQTGGQPLPSEPLWSRLLFAIILLYAFMTILSFLAGSLFYL